MAYTNFPILIPTPTKSDKVPYDPLKPIYKIDDQVYVLESKVDLVSYLFMVYGNASPEWFVHDEKIFMKAEPYQMVLLKFSR